MFIYGSLQIWNISTACGGFFFLEALKVGSLIFFGRFNFKIMANLCGIPKYPKITKKSTKIQKIRGSSWLAQLIQTTPKSIQMAFYGTLGMFKVIFDENRFFRDCCTLRAWANGRVLRHTCENHRKSPKITENQRKARNQGSKNRFFDIFPASLGLLSTFFGIRATFRRIPPY